MISIALLRFASILWGLRLPSLTLPYKPDDDRGVGLFAEELDPLLLERTIVLRGFDQIDEAFDGAIEALLQCVSGDALCDDDLMRLCERKHVGVDAHAEMLERDAQRPQTAITTGHRW